MQGKVQTTVRAMVSALDSGCDDDRKLHAVHAFDECVARLAASGAGGELAAAADLLAQSGSWAAALRGDRGPDVCDAVLNTLASLIPALAGISLSGDTASSDERASRMKSVGEELQHLRSAVPCVLKLQAVQVLSNASGPLLMAQLEANRGLQRYSAARCILTLDALRSLAPTTAPATGDRLNHQSLVQQLLRVARLSRDTRVQNRELALHAAYAALLASPARSGSDHKLARHHKRICALVWVHAAQLSHDPAPEIASASRAFLACRGSHPPEVLRRDCPNDSCCVKNTAGDGARETTVDECAGQDGQSVPGKIADQLDGVGVLSILSLLVHSLGLSSLSHHCCPIMPAPEESDPAVEEDEEDEAGTWLRHELERISVTARLMGIDATLIALRRQAADCPLVERWGARQEMALLGELCLAPRVLEASTQASTRLHGMLQRLGRYCAGAHEPSSGAGASIRESLWNVGQLVTEYASRFPNDRHAGTVSWGESWRTGGVGVVEEGDADAVCARCYVLCLQHALAQLREESSRHDADAACVDRITEEATWHRSLIRTAAAALQQATERVWACRVELAATAGDGGVGNVEDVGLGGYGGYGAGNASMIETELAASGMPLSISDAQERAFAIAAARVQAHLDLLKTLVTDSLDIDAGKLGGERQQQDTTVVALLALAEARNAWVWGIHRHIAETADQLLGQFSFVSQPCLLVSPDSSCTSATAVGTSPTTHKALRSGLMSRAFPPLSCGSAASGGFVGAPPSGQGSVRVYVDSSMLPRILWRQCQEALRDEEGIGETSSDVQYSAAATHDTATLEESCDGFEAPAACRGTAFLRATCLLWAAEQLSHGQGWVGGIWLGVAVALMQQAPYDLKTIGARLTLLLVNKADRTDVRLRESVVVGSLQSCLPHAHLPLLRAALPALVKAVTMIDGDAKAPTGPLHGGAEPSRVLILLLEHGLRDTNLSIRAAYVRAVTSLYDHLGSRALANMGPAIEMAVSVLGSGKQQIEQTLSGLGLLETIATTCWPRTHAYLREIVQATLRVALENRGHISDKDQETLTDHVTAILQALHAAHGEKLSSLLAPARHALPAVDQIVLSCGLI